MVLATSDAAFFSEVSSEQRQALIQWVQLGGRIVLSVGSRGADFAAADSPWSVLLPGTFQAVEPLRDRAGLENYTKAELPFNDPQFQRNRPVVTRLKNIRGEVLVDELGASTARPLVVRSAVGLGLVAFVGLDLDHPSLQNWKGRSRLLAALVARADREGEHAEREAHRGVTHLGYDDLIGQLRETFESGRTRPLEWRREQLKGLLAMLTDHEDAFVTALKDDLGRPVMEAFGADIGVSRLHIKHILKHFESWSKPTRVNPGMLSLPGKGEIIHEPLGVALIISP